jgi:hypothetical protein
MWKKPKLYTVKLKSEKEIGWWDTVSVLILIEILKYIIYRFYISVVNMFMGLAISRENGI